jgi:hypothetical protein
MIGEKRILLGVAIGAIIVYLLLKPKKAAAVNVKCEGDFAVQCNDGTCDVGNGVMIPCTGHGGVNDAASKKIPTKDCVLDYYDCSKSRYETIQIPMDADCNTYQPAKPQCMKRMDIDLTAPLLRV